MTAVNITRDVLRGGQNVDVDVICGELGEVLKGVGVGLEDVDGILLDVGVSPMQVDDAIGFFCF